MGGRMFFRGEWGMWFNCHKSITRVTRLRAAGLSIGAKWAKATNSRRGTYMNDRQVFSGSLAWGPDLDGMVGCRKGDNPVVLIFACPSPNPPDQCKSIQNLESWPGIRWFPRTKNRRAQRAPKQLPFEDWEGTEKQEARLRNCSDRKGNHWSKVICFRF